jgi:hypothetical protein
VEGTSAQDALGRDRTAELDDRRGVTDDLVHRAVRVLIEVGHQQAALVRVLGQQCEAMGDRVTRGLHPGYQQQGEEGAQLAGGETMAVDVRAHQRGDEIARGFVAALPGEFRHHELHMGQGPQAPARHAQQPGAYAAPHPDVLGRLVDAFGDLRPVAPRDSHQVADDLEGHTGGDG